MNIEAWFKIINETETKEDELCGLSYMYPGQAWGPLKRIPHTYSHACKFKSLKITIYVILVALTLYYSKGSKIRQEYLYLF